MVQKPKRFLSTPSARRATRIGVITRLFCAYFYPRPPRGGRRISKMFTKWSSTFLSTPSARRATHFAQVPRMQRPHFYPRPPRGGRLCAWLLPCSTFSFLSTPSARRATIFSQCSHSRRHDFYPRPPRGGRRRRSAIQSLVNLISIHALREEGDRLHSAMRPATSDFYPRPPRGGRRLGDYFGLPTGVNFYPRPPRGGRRRYAVVPHQYIRIFLSTPSARRATRHRLAHVARFCIISIHALREEGDPVLPQQSARHEEISIHALREEGDICAWLSPCNTSSFLSTPSARRATV